MPLIHEALSYGTLQVEPSEPKHQHRASLPGAGGNAAAEEVGLLRLAR